MLDVYKNMTTVRLYNKCKENGAGESIEVVCPLACPIVIKLGVCYVHHCDLLRMCD